MKTYLIWISTAILVAACCGPLPTPPVAPVAEPEPAPEPEPEEPTGLEALVKEIRAQGVVDTVHGKEVADPYRALEEEGDLTSAWIDAQNELTDGYMATNAVPGRAKRLGQLFSIGYYGQVRQAGDKVFYTKRDGDAEQAVLFVRDNPEADERVLVDPNKLGERIAIDWYYPSPKARYVAYGLSSGGDERSTLHVVEVEGGKEIDDQIPHTKWTSLSWLNDESGFYYARYPREGEKDYDPEKIDAYNQHLFFHKLGADPGDDPLVMRAPKPQNFVMPEVSDDDRYLSIVVFRSWSKTDLYLLDRKQQDPEPKPLVVGQDYLVYGAVYRQKLLVFSNKDHPKGRILVAPVRRAEKVDKWRELIAEGEGSIEGFYPAKDRLAVSYVENISARLRLYNLKGKLLEEIELPTSGTVSSIGTGQKRRRVVFTFNSFFHPPTLYVYAKGQLTEVDRVQADIDVEAYELERETVKSADGTPINVFLVHRADMPRDGKQKVVLTAYGGFNHSLMPGFQRNALYWLEQGGVYAVANIRGGGEFGEEWHKDGMLANKRHCFEDFEAVVRWLGQSGISSPERIAIIGASNGGLLMGAMLARCPEAFRAAVAGVGLYDMVRFSEFPPAEIWMGEYGDPAKPEEFEYLFAYSPYHHLEDGTPYPAVLVETAESDTRVSWRHSTKFAARLQEATSSERPILFQMRRDVGHGAGSGLSDIRDQYLMYYTFIETELGAP
jgi:prolyl oligopeptidase